MKEAVIVFITAKKIQSYVFSSNRLREHIGASHLIKEATTNWVDDTFKETESLKHKQVFDIAALNELEKTTREQPFSEEVYAPQDIATYDAVVISTGAGQVRLLIDADLYQEFIKNYTRKILKKAPGLPIYVGVSKRFPFKLEHNDLGCKIRAAQANLEEAEQTYQQSNPLLGLGVTVKCASTGLPASEVRHKPEPLLASRETMAKNNVVLDPKTHARAADKAIFEYLEKDPDPNYRMPLDFDHFGRTEEDQSYVAVVHIDGNNMGVRVGNYLAKAQSNYEFIAYSRYFSFSVERAVRKALQKVFEKAHPQKKASLDDNERGTWISKDGRSFELKLEAGFRYIPLRFLIIGGDDITFVCDGRLGLGLATLCLKELENTTIPDEGQESPLYACAGVSIVKTHYPFARAYDLAEELGAAAKELVRKTTEDHSIQGASALDWHLALSGLSGDLDTIRKREYNVAAGNLYLRPVLLADPVTPTAYRRWEVVSDLATTFAGQKDKEQDSTAPRQQWGERRNKVMQLREALRGGSNAGQQFTAYYGILPALSAGNSAEFQKSGWDDKTCVYFDAIEILDFYLPLYED